MIDIGRCHLERTPLRLQVRVSFVLSLAELLLGHISRFITRLAKGSLAQMGENPKLYVKFDLYPHDSLHHVIDGAWYGTDKFKEAAEEMNCCCCDYITHVTQIGVGSQIKSSTHVRLNFQKSGSVMKMSIVMRDRSKNRKPLQKGRSLSIEAIQTVQALKRATKQHSEVALEQVFDMKLRRLLKLDMIAVLRELLRQDQCFLALKVFEDVRKEDWYRPQLFLYTEMVTVLGRNGLLDKVELLILNLKAESNLKPDLEGFKALMESLMSLNLTGLAMECFYLMKSLSCDPDRPLFKILIDGLKSNGELGLLAIIQQDAEKYYGNFVDFLEEEES